MLCPSLLRLGFEDRGREGGGSLRAAHLAGLFLEEALPLGAEALLIGGALLGKEAFLGGQACALGLQGTLGGERMRMHGAQGVRTQARMRRNAK